MSGTFQHVKVVQTMMGMDVLLPIGITGPKAIKKIILGRVGVAEIYTSRNPIHLNKYWALVDCCAQAIGWEPEDLSKEMLKKLRFVDRWEDAFGNVYEEAKSIRLVGGMTQAEFESFFKVAVEWMAITLNLQGAIELLDKFNRILEGRGNEYDDYGWVAGNP